MKSNNLSLEWLNKANKNCLKFTFKETLTMQDAEIAIDEWRKMFQAKGNEPIVLIWDCRKMKGYESDVRAKWTEALKEMKSGIDTIWLISESVMIRMGASIMGMVTSLKIKTAVSEADIVV
jgi:hypothetical protein